MKDQITRFAINHSAMKKITGGELFAVLTTGDDNTSTGDNTTRPAKPQTGKPITIKAK